MMSTHSTNPSYWVYIEHFSRTQLDLFAASPLSVSASLSSKLDKNKFLSSHACRERPLWNSAGIFPHCALAWFFLYMFRLKNVRRPLERH